MRGRRRSPWRAVPADSPATLDYFMNDYVGTFGITCNKSWASSGTRGGTDIMAEANSVIEMVHAAFDANDHPGDRWLQGSFDGCEPYRRNRGVQGIARLADAGSRISRSALHRAQLLLGSRDSVLHPGIHRCRPAAPAANRRSDLPSDARIHGYLDNDRRRRTAIRATERANALIDPLRYGAMTSFDYARYRLSVFCREEAAAILAYLESRTGRPITSYSREAIEHAIAEFWRTRAASAPRSRIVAPPQRAGAGVHGRDPQASADLKDVTCAAARPTAWTRLSTPSDVSG